MAGRSTHRTLAIIGWVSLLASITYSVFSPATEYELSIYAATPLPVWILLGITATTATITVFSQYRRMHFAGLALATGAAATMATIPLARSYYFYGNRDALTHVGIVKSYLNGTMAGESIIYPLTHVFAVTISRLLDTTPWIALMILLPVFVSIFAVSGYLLARWLTGDRRVAAAGVLSTCLLLPLLSVRLPVLYPIPNTFAVFYFLFIIFVGARAAQHWRNTKWIPVVSVAVAAAAVLHPLLGGAMIAIFVAMAASGLKLEMDERLVLPAVLSLWALLWITRFGSRLEYFIGIWSLKVAGLGGDVSSAGESLGRIGISLPELALRLAGIKLIYLSFSIALGIWLLYTYFSAGHAVYERRQLALAIGVIPLGVGVAVFFGLGISNQWSRFLGFVLAVATVLGAVGIVRFSDYVFSLSRHQTAAIVVVFLLMMVPAAMVIHPSPFLVRSSQQTTDAQVTGYGHAFSTQASHIPIAGLYTLPKNFRHAHYGSVEAGEGLGVGRNSETVISTRPPSNLSSSRQEAFQNETYLIVTDTAVRVHLELFQSEVQGEDDLEALAESPGISRVYDNGDARQYLFE